MTSYLQMSCFFIIPSFPMRQRQFNVLFCIQHTFIHSFLFYPPAPSSTKLTCRVRKSIVTTESQREYVGFMDALHSHGPALSLYQFTNAPQQDTPVISTWRVRYCKSPAGIMHGFSNGAPVINNSSSLFENSTAFTHPWWPLMSRECIHCAADSPSVMNRFVRCDGCRAFHLSCSKQFSMFPADNLDRLCQRKTSVALRES